MAKNSRSLGPKKNPISISNVKRSYLLQFRSTITLSGVQGGFQTPLFSGNGTFSYKKATRNANIIHQVYTNSGEGGAGNSKEHGSWVTVTIYL